MKPASPQTLKKNDAWSIHVQEILHSLEIPSGLLSDNISESIGSYCREYHTHGVEQSDLLLLIARAYCAINEVGLAERIISSLPSHRRHCSRWLEILSELHHFPSLLPYFSNAIIRPADWAGAEQDRMWVLDLNRLQFFEEEAHEMMLYRSVRTLVENMYVFWDATSGEGILGLKGLSIQNFDERQGRTNAAREANDLFIYISDLFLQQQKIRDWANVPSILQLD